MKKIFVACGLLLASAGLTGAVEKLDRGVVAVKTPAEGVFVSWRSLSADPKGTTFDLYRDGVKVNAEPISGGTNYTDAAGTAGSVYTVKVYPGGAAEASETSKPTVVEPNVYKRVKLNRPAGGTTPAGEVYTYSPNDCSAGDVDGDGEMELFVKWDPSNSHDNSQSGYTGNVYIDCYKLDGSQLWRVDLGKNIRAGAHYTQFMVYDFDMDGKAEMICKTAPGSMDGRGRYVNQAATESEIRGADNEKDWRMTSGNNVGKVNGGQEYLTVFAGATGEALHTVFYNPNRNTKVGGEEKFTFNWDDRSGKTDKEYGNRGERYLACVAHLDGADKRASAVMCRGYYTFAYLWAVDFDGKELKTRWLHRSDSKTKYSVTDAKGETVSYEAPAATSGGGSRTAYGNGNHNLSCGDVDGDGRDEIVYGSCGVDHDGKLLYATGLGHGDAIHMSTLIPDREGLQVFEVHEESPYGWDLHDAATGEILLRAKGDKDNGRGLAADIWGETRGFEFMSSNERTPRNASTGETVQGKSTSLNFRVYWDDDLLDELLDGLSVQKWMGTQSVKTLKNFGAYSKASSCNTTKATPCLSADILGDWREEVILWDGENSTDLLIFTTTIPTKYRVPCLLEDHTYRMGVAWQNVAYNQPPHLGYYLPDLFNNEARLTITSGSMVQSVEKGYAINPIVGSWSKCDGVAVADLPEGLTADIDAANATFTISGTPAEEGEHKFSISTEGGEGRAVLEGAITVFTAASLEEVAHFSFEELTSTVKNHVEGSAAVKGSPTLVDGIYGKAIRLNGESDYLEQQAYAGIQMGESDFTIEFWFRSDDDAAYLFHKGSIANDGSTTTGNWIGIERKKDNLYFAYDDDKTKTQVTVTGVGDRYFNNEWHHLVCTRDGADKTANVYIDGELASKSADASGALVDNNEPLCIGNVNVNHDNYFKGDLDDLHIYRGAMTAAKVAERYKAGKDGSGISDVISEGAMAEGWRLYEAATGRLMGAGAGSAVATEGLQPGVYVLVVYTAEGRKVSKIVL